MTEFKPELFECLHCKETKPRSSYGTRTDTGRRIGTCKPCVARLAKERRTSPVFVPRKNRYDNSDGTRTCRVCRVSKPLDEFQPRQGRSGGARRNECRPCYLELARQRYADNPAKHRDVMRRAVYGLPLGEYDRMLAAQNELCAICGEPETSPDRRTGLPRGLFVDHHHATGQVRELLCMRCNMGIGQFRDNPGLLAKATAYLIKHQPA